MGGSPILPVGRTLYKPCIPSHTSCAKVAILLLQDLSTWCVTDIYGVYFHLSVQCLCYNKFITPWTHLISSNDRRSISQKDYLSLKIKRTCSWRNKFVLYIIYIYIYIFFKAVVIIMCDIFQVIENTFFCYANISQHSRIHKMFIFHTHCFQKY